MILELDHIYKNYNTGKLVVPVLHDVSLHVDKGEYVAIMGPSGSGKSTLMNIIGCLDRPTSGTYKLAGQDVLKKNEKDMADIRLNNLGFVFQNFQLLGKQTALANVCLPLIYAGVKKKERIRRATEALTRVGLADRINFTPAQLSGGQKQRVAVARAIVNNPQILLADEPTGALDSKSSIALMDLFEKLNDDGVTIVMITHSSGIAGYAKRICNIFDGVLTETASGLETGDEQVRLQAERIQMERAGELPALAGRDARGKENGQGSSAERPGETAGAGSEKPSVTAGADAEKPGESADAGADKPQGGSDS